MKKAKTKNIHFNLCYKCGFNVQRNEDVSIDCIYPLNRKKTQWNCYCNKMLGGCGRVVYASSLDTLCEEWNKGKTDDVN